MMIQALIAFGSNIAPRMAHLTAAARALRAIPGMEVVAASSLYETAPVGGPDAQDNYLNTVVKVETSLSARALLDTLHRIEASRDRTREVRWGPRTLDLDLLIHGGLISSEPNLQVPHPRMQDRRFVMVPAAEIAPDLIHPVLGRSMSDIAASIPVEDGDLKALANTWMDADPHPIGIEKAAS